MSACVAGFTSATVSPLAPSQPALAVVPASQRRSAQCAGSGVGAILFFGIQPLCKIAHSLHECLCLDDLQTTGEKLRYMLKL
jgi:hypothetical protein